jgi:hypothetical protein
VHHQPNRDGHGGQLKLGVLIKAFKRRVLAPIEF